MCLTSPITGWQLQTNGEFILANADRYCDLYFPLANEAGMMSAITPHLHGDIKVGQHAFLTPPVTVFDLRQARTARNFWVYLPGHGAWSVAGNSARQYMERLAPTPEEELSITAGFLWHKATRCHYGLGLVAEVTNFVPSNGDRVELMRVTLKNVGAHPLRFVPTAAIPLYCRSADNVRDHRHVSVLFHRIKTVHHGVVVRPTLTFDERGHRPNGLVYAVFGAEEDGTPPCGFFPSLEGFVGEGPGLDWPEAIVTDRIPLWPAGRELAGVEAMGGLRFAEHLLAPGERWSYVLAMVIAEEGEDLEAMAMKYCHGQRFEAHLHANKAYWAEKVGRLGFISADPEFDDWLRWVSVQPVLRRIFGCSFLPYHDYGRGGRGWRDLWQDTLALLLLEPERAVEFIRHGFAGVRIDGSNATIVGRAPGEFIADRNNLPRVWMDHGAWPFLTLRHYLDLTGDLRLLLAEEGYFRDEFLDRTARRDPTWKPEDGFCLRKEDGEVYTGSIFEHLLVQHLTAFFNVGEHNIIRLEGGDWNDGLDMARQRGESVAFTSLYAKNLAELAELAEELPLRTGIDEVEIAAELSILLDTLFARVDYDSPEEKRATLERYFRACPGRISGRKVRYRLAAIAHDLRTKAEWLKEWLRTHEWIADGRDRGWFNGYYDEDGRRVEGWHSDGVRMTLTGQVFALMAGVATEEQAAAVVAAVERYLRDPKTGGYRLNTEFAGESPKLGRAFGFAYGHKENGAVFSHMAVMYANALYRRGFVREGRAVIRSLYELSRDFSKSRIYPGLPEYFDNDGRGMYPYLTGSASWMLLTMLCEVYGVRGRLGDLFLAPKLLPEDFTPEGKATVRVEFAGRQLMIVYRNPAGLDYGEYSVCRVAHAGGEMAFLAEGRGALVKREEILALAPGRRHELFVDLG